MLVAVSYTHLLGPAIGVGMGYAIDAKGLNLISAVIAGAIGAGTFNNGVQAGNPVSYTYLDVYKRQMYQNVTIGGQTPDKKDATNELSYLVLKSVAQTRLPQPNLTVRDVYKRQILMRQEIKFII